MLSERTIINGLILTAGLIFGPYAVIAMLENNGWPFLIFAGSAFLLFIFFIVQDGVCILPLLGLSFLGKLNFMPLGFGAADLASLVLILYYSVAYLALRQRPITGGPLRFLLPILVLAAIVLYHDHSIGLKVMGSSQQGSRPGLFIFLAIATYICGINIPTPSLAVLRHLPWYAVAVTCLAAMPFFLTTYFPSLAPFIYRFVDTVNVNAYVESNAGIIGDSDALGRAGFQAGIGAAMQVFLISHFPIYSWWRPNRWPVALLSLLSFYLVMGGGYRSGLMLFCFVTLVGAWCYISWRVILIIPLAVLGLGALSFVQNEHPWDLQLPLIAQRSLSWLPGNWDEEAVESAKSSNDFRENIQRVYKREYLFKSPWIGNGFTFDANEAQILQDLAAKSDTYDRYYEAKSFIITKTFHVGWISLYDAVGLIGCSAFVILGANMLWALGRFIFGPDVDQHSRFFPLKVWLFCNISQSLFGYFTVFGNFSSTFPGLCAYGIILVHLERIERRKDQHVAPPFQEPLFHVPARRPRPVSL